MPEYMIHLNDSCSCFLLTDMFSPSLCMVKLHHSLRHSLNFILLEKLIVHSSEYLGFLFLSEYSIYHIVL